MLEQMNYVSHYAELHLFFFFDRVPFGVATDVSCSERCEYPEVLDLGSHVPEFHFAN
jgi:hypothetical protein